MTQQVLSYQIADSIDIKNFRAVFKAELRYSDESELFYRMDNNQFVYVFKYGAVCFLNTDVISISNFLQLVKPYCKNLFEKPLEEMYYVEANAAEKYIGYQKMSIRGNDETSLRLVMLNVSQSVALDYYSDQTTRLLEETNLHTQKLVNKGRLAISGMNLKRYIGKTLLLKNRIAENLYVFDSPEETWENEELDKLDADLKKTFDIQQRVRNIHEGLAIIKDNLELFRALMQYRNSNILEWIIIILIFVEVINLLLEKLF